MDYGVIYVIYWTMKEKKWELGLLCWVCPCLALPHSVSMCESLGFSELRFPHSNNRDSNLTYLQQGLLVSKERIIVHVKALKAVNSKAFSSSSIHV